MPEDALAMERYLGSGAIKGIGAALAGRIVRHFGDDTFQIVENEPERLSEVKGISEKNGKRDCHADRGKVRYAEGNDVFAEIWDFTEPWCQNLPEVWRLCLQCFAGKTRIDLQMISVVWDSVSQMRSPIALEFIQIQITE